MLTAASKYTLYRRQSLLLPATDLARMNAILTSNFVHRLLLLQSLQGYSPLGLRAVTFTFYCHRFLFVVWTFFILVSGPKFGEYHTEADADALLTPEDLQAWENEHGPIPEGACVAMNSGWDARVNQAGAFRNADEAGIMHFPGFHADSAQFLMEERDCKGLAVDTLSLDYGGSSDFPVHYSWLPSNRWGLECVANLANLPAKGATLVVGAPKFQGATGGPTRLIALY